MLRICLRCDVGLWSLRAAAFAQLAFCTSVLEHQAAFSEAAMYGESRRGAHERLLKLVDLSGGDVEAVRESIRVLDDGNRLWRTVQLDAL